MDDSSPEKLEGKPEKVILPPRDRDELRRIYGLTEHIGSKSMSSFYGERGVSGGSSINTFGTGGNPPRRAPRGQGHPNESG